ncbi:MAG: TonB-dependent receptor, partial [Oleiharenicola lentus]
LSLEYYFDKSGLVTAGVFEKDISNFFESRSGTVDAALANTLGLGPEFIGWGVSTTVNGSGTATINGYELSIKHDLGFIPGIGRYLSINANGTHLSLNGPNVSAFANFIPETANLGFSWNKKPVSAKLNFNYRGRQLRSAQTGAQYGATNSFYEYYAPRMNVDVNVEYTLTKRFVLFANARNIFNKPQVLQRYSNDAGSARYAVNYQQEEFGIQIAAGLKGTF